MSEQSSQSIRVRRLELWRKFGDWGLILTGATGFLVGLLDLIVNLSEIPILKEPQAIILLLVSFLAIAVGIERRTTIEEARQSIERAQLEIVTPLRDLQEEIKNLRQTSTDSASDLQREVANVQRALISTITFRTLLDEKAVYEEAKRLVENARDSDLIKATSLAINSSQAATEWRETGYHYDYLVAIAKRIKEAKERGGPLTYRVVLGNGAADNTNLTPSVKRRVRQRGQIFKNENVLDRLRMRAIDTSWSLDVLIVGDSMIVGFTTIDTESNIRQGLRITDKDFVGSCSQWFDDFLWSAAKTIAWTDGDSDNGAQDNVHG